jgi:nucleoside-diphosphate-sugar epimerase
MLLRTLGPFNETMRELAVVKPFWDHPVRLDNARLVALIGPEPQTPLTDAVRETLRGLGCVDAQST